MLKILDKEHREKLEQNVQELTERLALEEKQRQESALKEKEEELRHIFELEGQKMVKTAVEEKESEVRSLLEDEYLLTLKDSLEKQEVELNRKFEEQEKEKIQTKEHEWQVNTHNNLVNVSVHVSRIVLTKYVCSGYNQKTSQYFAYCLVVDLHV